MVDGQPFIGVNSKAPGYTHSDDHSARDMRARLIEKYPEVDVGPNLGSFPKDALFQGEATALMRAAGATAGLWRDATSR